jgi:hypothetical protein
MPKLPASVTKLLGKLPLKPLLDKWQIKPLLSRIIPALKRMPRSTIYAIISALLLLGWLSSVGGLLQQGDIERAEALKTMQRVVFAGDNNAINAAPKSDPLTDFDVESPEERKLRETEKKSLKDGESDKDTAGNIEEVENAEEAEHANAAGHDAAIKEAADHAAKSDGNHAVAHDANHAASQDAAHENSAAVNARKVSPQLQHLTLLQQSANAVVPIIHHGEKSLVFAPAREISKKSKWGLLPKKGHHHARASDLYARNYVLDDKKPMLGIVLTSMGFSAQSLNIALSLPLPVTLSFSPYAPQIKSYIETTRNVGHEIWVDIPAQNAQYPAADPGPYGMIATLGKPVLKKRLQQIMAASLGAVGGVFSADETLRKFPNSLNFILEQLSDHGLHSFFVAKNLPKTKHKANLRAGHMVVPANTTPVQLKSLLSRLTQRLKSGDAQSMVISFSGSVSHLQLLKNWLAHDMADAPVSLAPLSAFYIDHEALKAAAEKAKEAAKKSGGGHGGGGDKPSSGGGH